MAISISPFPNFPLPPAARRRPPPLLLPPLSVSLIARIIKLVPTTSREGDAAAEEGLSRAPLGMVNLGNLT